MNETVQKPPPSFDTPASRITPPGAPNEAKAPPNTEQFVVTRNVPSGDVVSIETIDPNGQRKPLLEDALRKELEAALDDTLILRRFARRYTLRQRFAASKKVEQEPMVTLDEIKDGLGETKEEMPGNERALAAFLLGGAKRRMRLRRLLLAELLGGSAGESEDDDDSESGLGERKLIGLLLGRRMLRRRRLRRALIAHLLSGARGESEEDDDDDSSESEENGEGTLLRMVFGKRAVRRGRLRRLLVAHLLREHGEEVSDDDEGDDDSFEGFGERKLAKLLLGRRGLRRSALRKYAVSELLAN